MNRVALLLWGIAHRDHFVHTTGERKNQADSVDYRASLANYRERIFEFVRAGGYEIDVFICTAPTPIFEQLLADYQPVRWSVTDDTPNAYQTRNTRMVGASNLCLQYSIENDIEYAFVISTRFDLHFNEPFRYEHLRLDHINIVSILEKPHLICDNLYIMPFWLLGRFKEIFERDIARNAHYFKAEIERLGPVHYFKNEHRGVGHLSFYRIVRLR